MKNSIVPIILFSLLSLVSCKDEPQGAYDPVTNTDTEYSQPEAELDSEIEEDIDNGETETDEEADLPGSGENSEISGSSNKNRSTIIAGTYIKVGEEKDSGCNCYCLDINFNSGSELCLVQNEQYINTRFQKNSDNTINVFFVGPSSRNKQSEIPFQDFDKDTPIATISPLSNGELELNWLGFKSNGDLLTDYAIYGKKTLEGNYKRK